MDSDHIERRLAAILSADAVGYSRLMAEDEAGTIRTLTAYRTEVSTLVEQHRGRVVDAPGDNILAEFPSALDAVECALEVQRVLRARNEGLPEVRRMEFRIGVHLGDVSVQQGRVYGEGVNVAARIEALSDPGGVCISDPVHQQVRHKLDLDCEDLGEQEVKNIPDPVRVHRVRLDSARARAPKPSGLAWRRRKIAAACIAAGVVGVAAGLWVSWPAPLGRILDLRGPPVSPPLSEPPSIAVLAFVNMSGDPEQEYFSDGITEELLNTLTAIEGLRVAGRTSSFSFKGKDVDLRTIGEALGVSTILEGSVRQSGNRLRITAQLISAADGFHLWSKSYDRELADIFGLQEEIAGEIANALQVKLGFKVAQSVARRTTDNLDAYTWLMRGGEFLKRGDSTNVKKALEAFERAIELDPEYAPAYVGSASANMSLLAWGLGPADRLGDAERRLQQALTLDPGFIDSCISKVLFKP